MNKYAALCTAALVILSSAAVAGADADGEAVESFEVGDDKYYVHESGLYKETNGFDGLQLDGGTTSEAEDYGPDERVENTLGL